MNGVRTETQRKGPRAKIAPNEIVYLNFLSGNGAIVLDVSAKGLGFQAADPLEPNESLSFRLAAPACPDIDLSGQIVWLDATRRRGGLRLAVPASVLPMYREWERKYLEPLAEIDELPATGPAPVVAPASAAPPQSEAARPSAPPPAAFNHQRGPVLGGRGPIFVSEWEAPPEQTHASRNVLVLGVIVALALVFGGTYYFGGRQQIGDLFIRLGQTISGEHAQQPARSRSTNAAAQNFAPPTTRDTAAPAPLSRNAAMPGPTGNAAELAAPELSNKPRVNPTIFPKQPSGGINSPSSALSPSPPTVASNAGPIAPPANAPRSIAPSTRSQSQGLHASPAGTSAPNAAAASGNAAASEVAQARKYLQDSNPADSAIVTNLLWSAIQDGSTQAELILGDIYLHGQDGVAKNCAQAEALLNAAQAANVPGSAEKLQELATYGCR